MVNKVSKIWDHGCTTSRLVSISSLPSEYEHLHVRIYVYVHVYNGNGMLRVTQSFPSPYVCVAKLANSYSVVHFG